ncbi:MAG: ATPase [Rikenellaceae bacterium]|jgi:N-acetylglucosamine kinase-like BadF-type ATPase|nr:ATPase [Rikenellaceae bacterium]
MNILIADSGSTKTQWALVSADGGCVARTTGGINPVHTPVGEVEALLQSEFAAERGRVDAVRFYGAGCLPSTCGAMTGVLSRFFGTDDVTVESDLLGALRGVLGDRPGVGCILGTGSNSALYDGRQVVKHIPPLGYLLGDEGSGADLGRRLIGNLLKGLLPEELTAAFWQTYPLGYEEIIEAVYRKPGANRFLAQFAPFLCKYIDHPAARSIVDEAFVAFVERNLLAYDGIRQLPVSFTGSIAFYFETSLRRVLERYGLALGTVEQSPLPGLIQYHTNKIITP